MEEKVKITDKVLLLDGDLDKQEEYVNRILKEILGESSSEKKTND